MSLFRKLPRNDPKKPGPIQDQTVALTGGVERSIAKTPF
jgi:hypothetical protein